MAEGWARFLGSSFVEAYSAGIEASTVNPLAIKAMREVGVDISHHRSKIIDEFSDIELDIIVTVCSNAESQCPSHLLKGRTIHRSFDDPPKLAESESNEDDALKHYRRVRDEIKIFVQELLEEFNKSRSWSDEELG